jgi:hypothetical protein
MRIAVSLAVLCCGAACLGGCSDSVATGPMAGISQLMRSYDHTLTPNQQKAAIAQLQQDQAKQADDAASETAKP